MIFEKRTIREILDEFVNLLVWLSLFLLIFSFLLVFFQKERIKRIEQKITQTIEKEKETQKEYFEIKKRIDFLKNIFPKITFPTKILDFIEKEILPEVSLSSLKCNIDKKEVILEGIAPNLIVLQQQIDVFKEEKRVTSSLEKISSSKEGINFIIKFNFEEQLIK